MTHRIIGDPFPVLLCALAKGEKMITQRGGMSWRSAGITMETNSTGGVMKGLKRTLAGNNFFLNHYTAIEDEQEIAFGLSFPGEIKTFDISGGRDIVAQKNAFIACTDGVDIDIFFNKRLGAGFLSGEGFILERFSGNGLVFIEIDGHTQEYNLAPGEKLIIDQGYLAAMEPTVTLSVEMVKGMKNRMFGGEGFFLGNLTGPGKVWLQTLPISGLARAMGPVGGAN
ncbi:MAG: TIGR00266 family protein [Defluviitaleaceae bacterium]|nr:TIGR00266 family protein [Defluviitaleaceae bacterium]